MSLSSSISAAAAKTGFVAHFQLRKSFLTQKARLISSRARQSWRRSSRVALPAQDIRDSPPLTRSSDDIEQKAFFDWLERKLCISCPEDWYDVRSRQVIQVGGAVLLVHIFQGSIAAMVHQMRPDHVWLPWLWRTRPKTSPKSEPAALRAYLLWTQKHTTDNTSLVFWYSVSLEWIRQQKGGLWFTRNAPPNVGLPQILQLAFPEHDWNLEKFGKAPNPAVLPGRLVLDHSARRMGIDELRQWYLVEPSTLNSSSEERKLLASFKGSLANALISCYPEHNWEPWKFKKAPSNFWKSPLNRRAYLTWLANTLRISSPSDWYSLTGSDLVNNHGGTLWRMHKGSVVDCLRSVFPEHNFQPWKFNKSQSRLWGDVSVCRSFLDHVSRELAIAKPSGWKDVTQKKIAELGGQILLQRYGDSLEFALRDAYPEENWDAIFIPAAG